MNTLIKCSPASSMRLPSARSKAATRVSRVHVSRQCSFSSIARIGTRNKASSLILGSAAVAAASIMLNSITGTNANERGEQHSCHRCHLCSNSSNDSQYSAMNISNLLAMALNCYWPLMFISLIVIATYLIYYFTSISKKPKFIGNRESKFVQFVKTNLSSTIEQRFNPLIYFWGPNAQTALFGYLQGQTSLSQQERHSQIKRQFLYVSDLQYLTSNLDMDEFYEKNEKNQKNTSNDCHFKVRLSSAGPELNIESRISDQSWQERTNTNNNNSTTSTSTSTNNNDNIRIALEDLVSSNNSNQVGSQLMSKSSCSQCSCLCSSGSSSNDSGVFGFGVHSAKASTISSSSSSSSSSSNGLNSSSETSTNSSRTSMSSLDADADAETETETETDEDMAKDFDRTNYSSSYCSLSSQIKSASSKLKEPPTKGAPSKSCSMKAIEATIKNKIYNQFELYSSKEKQVKDRLEFGQCALDWFVDSHDNYHKNKLVALISAGMTTGSDKKYVTDSVETLTGLGYECCVFIRRGVGGLKLSSAKFFSAAKWRDFEAAVNSVRQQRPGARLVAIGFSFGSIELCRYLAMSGRYSLVDAALLISCPFDSVRGGENMRNGTYLNRRIDAYLAKNLGIQLYRAMLVDDESSEAANISTTTTTNNKKSDTKLFNLNLKRVVLNKEKLKRIHKIKLSNNFNIKKKLTIKKKAKCKAQIWTNQNGSECDLAKLPKLKSLHDFEYRFNRIIQHYPNREAYNRDCQLDISTITVPTLCLSSEDDFMAPVQLLPLNQIEANSNICMILTKRGGHMAFVDGLIWPKKPYFAQRIISDFMGAMKQQLIQQKNHPLDWISIEMMR